MLSAVQHFMLFASRSISELEKLHAKGESISESAAILLSDCPHLTVESFYNLLAELSIDLPEDVWVPHPRFGNLSLAIASSEKLVFELLFWDSQVTAIHQHSFHGAFLCMSGRRLHCRWKYTTPSEVSLNADISDGNLSCHQVELLHNGDIRTIEPGPASIHSLWSIDRPVVTALLREKGSGSGDSYLFPGISFNERQAEHHYLRRKPLLDILRIHDSQRYNDVVHSLGKSLSAGQAIFYSQMLGPIILESYLQSISGNSKLWGTKIDTAFRFDELLQEATSLSETVSDPIARTRLAYSVLSQFMSGDTLSALESACKTVVSNAE